jgi:CRP/FNR family transcriptional regulator, cyclic AMP receptor protein
MPAFPDPSALSNLPLFRDLTRDQLAWVNERLRRQTYPANTTVFAIEQPAEVVYIVLTGTTRIHVEQMSGADVFLDISGPGDVLGEMAVIDGVGRSASAMTQEESVLLWMDRNSFLECLRIMPTVAINLMRVISSRLRFANERIQAFASLDVYGRVARHILAFGDKYGQAQPNGDVVIPIRLTQTDIADLVGASRERVNQIMSFYRQRKYISVDRNYRITIHNRQGLQQHSQ